MHVTWGKRPGFFSPQLPGVTTWREGVETHFFVAKMADNKKSCQIVNQIVAIGRCCHVDLLGKNSEQDLSAFSNSMII